MFFLRALSSRARRSARGMGSSPLGGALGHVGQREVRLENADLRVVIPLRGHAYRLEDRHTGEHLVRLFKGQVGPPYPPMYMDDRKSEARLEQGAGSVTCVLTQRQDDLIRERHPPDLDRVCIRLPFRRVNPMPKRVGAEQFAEHRLPVSRRRESRGTQLNGAARSIHFSRSFSFGLSGVPG